MSQYPLGYFRMKKSVKKIGAKHGRVEIEMDDHALAYLLKGMNCRIEHYETMQSKGPLPTDDQVSFDYTKKLRDELESARNSTL